MELRLDRCLLIGTQDTVINDLYSSVRQANPFLPIVKVNHWPGPEDLEKTLRTHRPSIVFLEVEDLDSALEVNSRIRELARGTQIVAFSKHAGENNLLRLMRAGINEWLRTPFQEEETKGALARVAEALLLSPPAWSLLGHVFSFLPAKPGSGASTVALNVAAAIARTSDARVALLDFDLNCGILGFLLKAGEGPCILDAAENIERLDQNVWARMIYKFGNLDLLRSGVPRPGMRIEATQVQRLLAHAQSQYPVTCVDLSGNLERYSMEALERSSVIFQVCTLDLASLHLARRNLELLETLNLRDRVQTIVNRASYRRGLTAQAVCQCLDVKEFIPIPNSYSELEAALAEGRPVGPESVVGSGFDRLAHALLGVEISEPSAGQHNGGLSFADLKSIVSAFGFRGKSKRLPPKPRKRVSESPGDIPQLVIAD